MNVEQILDTYGQLEARCEVFIGQPQVRHPVVVGGFAVESVGLAGVSYSQARKEVIRDQWAQITLIFAR